MHDCIIVLLCIKIKKWLSECMYVRVTVHLMWYFAYQHCECIKVHFFVLTWFFLLFICQTLDRGKRNQVSEDILIYFWLRIFFSSLVAPFSFLCKSLSLLLHCFLSIIYYSSFSFCVFRAHCLPLSSCFFPSSFLLLFCSSPLLFVSSCFSCPPHAALLLLLLFSSSSSYVFLPFSLFLLPWNPEVFLFANEHKAKMRSRMRFTSLPYARS